MVAKDVSVCLVLVHLEKGRKCQAVSCGFQSFFFFNVMSWWFVFSITMAIPASFEGVGDLVLCFCSYFCGLYFVLLTLWGLGIGMEVRGQLVRIWSSLSAMWIPGMEFLTC